MPDLCPPDQKASEHVIDDRDAGVFRVHRSTMVAPEILELERRRVFDRVWVYVGHESEVPNPQDFVCRSVAGRPLIMVRDEDGAVHTMLNSCAHRGAVICRERSGNARFFRCIYHAWTYDDTGALVTLPGQDAYADGFSREERSLVRPRTESYRGFVFTTFSSEVEPLTEYLAGARHYIDLIADQSGAGMRVVEGTHEYSARANWKLLVENSIDGYHGMPVHITYGEDQLARMRAGGATEMPKLGEGGHGLDLGNGHAVIQYPAFHSRAAGSWKHDCPVALRPVVEEQRARLIERVGPEHAQEIADSGRNLLVFPNLIVIDAMAITIRTFSPVTPDFMDITAWELAPSDEPPELHAWRLESFLGLFGPGGMATPDDIEVLELCQRGFATAQELPWSDISRGMHRAEPNTEDELQMRAFWRRWSQLMADPPVQAVTSRSQLSA